MMRLLLPLTALVLVACAQTERIDPLGGDPVTIDPTKPPSGIYLVQILLENQSLPLKGTGCASSASTEDKRRLQHALALALGSEIDDPRHQNVLSGSCQTDQFELPSGEVIDIWNCNIAVVEEDKESEYFASSHIYFGVTRDTWKLVPEKLFCT